MPCVGGQRMPDVKDVIKLWEIVAGVSSPARHQFLQNETIILHWPILMAGE